MYNVMFKNMYTLWNGQVNPINLCITSHTYCLTRTLNIYSLGDFQVHNILLLNVVSILFNRALELILST